MPVSVRALGISHLRGFGVTQSQTLSAQLLGRIGVLEMGQLQRKVYVNHQTEYSTLYNADVLFPVTESPAHQISPTS